MAAKEISVKKYVVRLSGEERERLEVMLRKGKSPARQLVKARILLKADVSDAGEAWSDSRIIEALETGPSMVYRVRKQLVEEGFEAALSRKQRVAPAVPRIFDGEKEAKLIALACSQPPKGRARWTLRLLDARQRAGRSAARGQRRCAWDHPGDRRSWKNARTVSTSSFDPAINPKSDLRPSSPIPQAASTASRRWPGRSRSAIPSMNR